MSTAPDTSSPTGRPRTLPYGICVVCSKPARYKRGQVCLACQKRAQRQSSRVCVSRDHPGNRFTPANLFRPNHNACNPCLNKQVRRARLGPVPPATDPRSSSAYANMRSLTIALLLGKPI